MKRVLVGVPFLILAACGLARVRTATPVAASDKTLTLSIPTGPGACSLPVRRYKADPTQDYVDVPWCADGPSYPIELRARLRVAEAIETVDRVESIFASEFGAFEPGCPRRVVSWRHRSEEVRYTRFELTATDKAGATTTASCALTYGSL